MTTVNCSKVPGHNIAAGLSKERYASTRGYYAPVNNALDNAPTNTRTFKIWVRAAKQQLILSCNLMQL